LIGTHTEAVRAAIISQGDESSGEVGNNLIGTLCDLMSGSGDKGTPIIHIQGYFDNYASD